MPRSSRSRRLPAGSCSGRQWRLPRRTRGGFDGLDTGDEAGVSYIIIDVVRPFEVGFIAVDVTKVVKDELGKDAFQRLKGKKAHVTVVSRYGKRLSAEADTNDEGVANIDVKQLAENPENKDVGKLDRYASARP